MRRTAALIVGGGPAGSTAAIALAGHGIRGVILERDREVSDALCGGFLSWRTLAALDRIGISASALNPIPVTRLRVFSGAYEGEARLPAPARAVSRARLDRLLLQQALERGAGVERGVRASSVADGTVHLRDGASLHANAVLLATGKHDLRGAPRVDTLPPDPVMGLRVRLTPRRVAADTIELHTFRGGYAGVVVQEDGSANLCMAIARSRLRSAGDPVALLRVLARENPALAARLDALQDATSVYAIANVPYGWRAIDTDAGVYRLGDQAAVIPSLAGEGIGIAVASGTAAAQAMVQGMSAAAYQRSFARRVARPLAMAGIVRHLAERPDTARVLARLVAVPGLARLLANLTRVSHLGIDAG